MESAVTVIPRCWSTSAITAGAKNVSNAGGTGARFCTSALTGRATVSGTVERTTTTLLSSGRPTPSRATAVMSSALSS